MGKKGVAPKGIGNRGKGRKAGVPNKITTEVKAAWEEAIAHAQATEGAGLKDWAVANPDKFWPMTMQMVPKNLAVDLKADTLAAALTAIAERG